MTLLLLGVLLVVPVLSAADDAAVEVSASIAKDDDNGVDIGDDLHIVDL